MRPPRVTVFTPSNRTRFLDECLESLLAQTYQDWEWVVLLNQGMRWRPERDDPRVRVVMDDNVAGVGAAKRRSCAEAAGEILLEFDHDDLLTPDCLAEVVDAFDAHPEVGFVYSDFAQIGPDRSRNDSRFNESYGWVYREETVAGHEVLVCEAMPPTPHNVSYIWYAPNHVRAFRRELYEKVGGYDETLTVADDHDLMCRLYQVTEFHHIRRCLYLQRMHTANTQFDPQTNAKIQELTVQIYNRNVQLNALAWAKRRGLSALYMGVTPDKPEGFTDLDRVDAPGIDIAADLAEGIKLPDNSVGVVHAVDFLQHLPDKVALFNELYRVLAPNGMLLSSTPSTDGRGAFQDPSHVAFYNENSFWYFTDRKFARYVPSIRCRFQVSRMGTQFPTDWHKTHQISYVSANLIAIKDDVRNGGPLNI